MSATAARHELGPVDQIPPGQGRSFQVGERRVAVFRGRDGCVYATQADCPHRGGPLANGLVGSGTLVCPLHERRFDLEELAAHQHRRRNSEHLLERAGQVRGIGEVGCMRGEFFEIDSPFAVAS